MKKTVAFVLFLFITASLAACGSQSTTADEIESQTAFDTSQTDAEYEMPVPTPPFTRFSVEKSETASGTVEYFIMSTDTDEVNALTENDLTAYCKTLQEAGFCQVERELEYSKTSCIFEAYTKDNTSYVFVECDSQSKAIVIIVNQYSAEDAERIK